MNKRFSAIPKMVLVCLALLLMLGTSAHAQSWRDVRLPNTLPAHQFTAVKPLPSRHVWLLEMTALGAAETIDWYSTARDVCHGWACNVHETNQLLGREPSNPRIITFASAEFVGLGLMLHRTERSPNKWVRWTGRAVAAYQIEDHTRLGIHNLRSF